MPATMAIHHSLGLLLLTAILCLPVSTLAEYEVTVNSETPLVAQACLRLPPADGTLRTLTLRGVAWGLPSQISEVSGENGLLPHPGDGEWIAPADCRVVRWKIDFRESTAGTIKASAQQSVFIRDIPWWLIAEPTALLRVKGATEESSLLLISEPQDLVRLGAMPWGDDRWRIPTPQDAPEFFVVGKVNPVEVVVDGFHVTYVADDGERVAGLGLQQSHAAAFRYLRGLLPELARVPEAERRLLVVWMCMNAAQREIGGAAGSRSFIANYVHDAPAEANDFAAANLMVIAHEQFHQLTDLVAEDRVSRPVWVNESLAQYFGLKAIERSGLPQSSLARIRNRFIEPDRKVEVPLLTLSRRYAAGDRSVYPLFYSQGATFWAELDRVLSEGSRGQQTLGDLLPALLQLEFDEAGMLPEPFLSRLRSVAGSKIDELVLRFVGSWPSVQTTSTDSSGE